MNTISKLIKFSGNTEPLVEITTQKGEKINISWRCLSALVEAKIASTYLKILLNEEKLIVKETVLNDLSLIEGECFEI